MIPTKYLSAPTRSGRSGRKPTKPKRCRKWRVLRLYTRAYLPAPIAALGVLVSALLGCDRREAVDRQGPSSPLPERETIRWQGQDTGYRGATSDTGDDVTE